MTWGHLRSVLGACWGVLVSFLDLLEGSWRHLGAILEYLEGSLGGRWRHLGGRLGQIYGYFGYAMTKHVLQTFFCMFFYFLCKLSFCETLIFVAPVEVFEGFFKIRFLGYRYRKKSKPI